MYKKILVPIDGSEHSSKTVRQAADLASNLGADIFLFHVVQPLPSSIQGSPYAKKLLEEVLRNGETILKEEKSKISPSNMSIDIDMVVGNPAEEIIKKAEDEKCDLIVIGNKGQDKNRGFIMGSVSKRVVRHAHSPVLIVK